MQLRWASVLVGVLLLGIGGCHSQANRFVFRPAESISETTAEIQLVRFDEGESADVSKTDDVELIPLPASDSPQIVSPEVERIQPQSALSLEEVSLSVRRNFPLIHQAAAARGIASGEALSASGAFDHKLEMYSESQPLDFYKNYRNSIGVARDTMWGGETFAGYRIGRGFFEPWYLERETNKGGEFKTGFVAPLVQDRWIDANRAELWQAQLEQQRVEPEIMAEVIRSVRDGSIAYWNWVAAGENYKIAQGLLRLAKVRNQGLEDQVEAQEKAPIDLVDNRRIIVSREAKLIDARRKLEQAAIKLSLYYRSDEGETVLPDSLRLPTDFNQMAIKLLETFRPRIEAKDISLAISQRPELAELQVLREQLGVALRQARNETLPDVDGGLLVAQDVGAPTSPKRDKSQLKLEGLISVAVPLERRKAQGKVRSLRWKMAQVAAKNRFAADKIVAEVRLARAALSAAHERVVRARENYDLALQMQEAEQELFDQGQSTLFNLNIREQQAAEAAVGRLQALLEYFVAKTDYVAALGYDRSDPMELE